MPSPTAPRVLIVTPWPTFWSMGGGAGCSDEYETLRGFVAAGFDVQYVLPGGGPDPQGDPLTARARFSTFPDPFASGHWMPAPGKRLWWYPRFAWRSRAAAMRVARDWRPHVVFGYSPYGVPAALGAARVCGAASVVKLFGVRDLVVDGRPRWGDWYTNAEALYAYRAPVTRLIALDDGTRGDVAARREGVPASRFLWWPNGSNVEWGDVDPAPLRASVRARLGVGEDTRVVLSLSRMVGYKRVDRVVRMAPALRAARRGAATLVVIAGDGPSARGVQGLARTLASRISCASSARCRTTTCRRGSPRATSSWRRRSRRTPASRRAGAGLRRAGGRGCRGRDGGADPRRRGGLHHGAGRPRSRRGSPVLAAPPGAWRDRARAVAARRTGSWAVRVGREVALVRELAAAVDACRA